MDTPRGLSISREPDEKTSSPWSTETVAAKPADLFAVESSVFLILFKYIKVRFLITLFALILAPNCIRFGAKSVGRVQLLDKLQLQSVSKC